MPVISTSPGILLPFVNELEKKIQEMAPKLQEWEDKKAGIYKAQNDLEVVQYRTTTALAQGSNANSELNNATIGINATSPNKLSTLIANLRKEMVALAAGVGEGGPLNITTFAVKTIQERDEISVAIDGAICLVEDARQDSSVEYGFAVYIKSGNRWIKISDEPVVNIKQEVKSIEARIHKLEGGLTIYEGSEEPENKDVLWID